MASSGANVTRDSITSGSAPSFAREHPRLDHRAGMRLAGPSRMEGYILVAALVLPGVLTAALRRTVMFWLPGTGLLILGFVAFGSMSDTHGDVGGLNAMANGVLALAGIGAIVYGLVCLFAGAFGYTRS